MDKGTEILIEAKRLLEEELEWCKNNMYVRDKNQTILAACAVGAISLASGMQGKAYCPDQINPIIEGFNTAYNRLQVVVDNTAPGNIVANFNDDPNTTREDVLLAFKRAIHEAEIIENG